MNDDAEDDSGDDDNNKNDTNNNNNDNNNNNNRPQTVEKMAHWEDTLLKRSWGYGESAKKTARFTKR